MIWRKIVVLINIILVFVLLLFMSISLKTGNDIKASFYAIWIVFNILSAMILGTEIDEENARIRQAQEEYDESMEYFLRFLEEMGYNIEKVGDRNYKVVKPKIRKEKIPDYADLFTFESFRQQVIHGYITNLDGTGYYSDGFCEYDIEVDCNNLIDKFSHICWYNK